MGAAPLVSDLLPATAGPSHGIVNVGPEFVASRAGATNLPYREVFKT